MNEKKKRRPRIDIDWDKVNALCRLHCTGEEIAGFFKISYDTLHRAIKREFGMNFAEYFKKHSVDAKISLRRKQFEVAQGGNVPMLIWLGKQYLEQTDKVQQDNISKDGSMSPRDIRILSKDEFADIMRDIIDKV